MQKFFNRRQADPSQRNPAPLEGNENSESKQNGIFSKTVRGHLVAMSGEFVGTTMFLFFAFGGTQIANTITPASAPDLQQLLFISLSFGFSLAVTAWVFYRISGGLFNPAVTLGMMISNTLPWTRGLLLLPAQMAGGLVAAGLVSCMFPGPLAVNTTLSHNPTRSFGPCAVNRNFPGYHWIYWLGPAFGAILAAGYYKFAKYSHYEEANPGQDASHPSEDDPERGE
ncbi:MAG: hypothetical protein Q9175_000123 [Cornicularia normoerica]